MGKSFIWFNKKSNSIKKINNKLFAVQHSFIPSNNKNFFDFYNSDFNCDYLLLSDLSYIKKSLRNFHILLISEPTKKNQIKSLINRKMQNSSYFYLAQIRKN